MVNFTQYLLEALVGISFHQFLVHLVSTSKSVLHHFSSSMANKIQAKKTRKRVKPKMHFFDLPLELRWMIYELAAEDATRPEANNGDSYTPTSVYLILLLTSRQVYTEAKEFLFKKVLFVLDMRQRRLKRSDVATDHRFSQFSDIQLGEGPRPLDRLLDTLMSLRKDTRTSIRRVIVLTPVTPMGVNTNTVTIFTKVHDIVGILVHLLPRLSWLGVNLCPGSEATFIVPQTQDYSSVIPNNRIDSAIGFAIVNRRPSIPFGSCNLEPYGLRTLSLWAHCPKYVASGAN
jgi:hypothetical protein